jgi:disulfide bond formation protein DsbB
LVSTPFTLSMSPATRLEITATADAMASRSMAGFGGAAFFPNMNVIYSPWTQLTYHVHTVVHSSLMSFTTCSIDCAFLRRFRFHKDLHNNSCVWVQFRITLAEASEAWSWVGNDMQKHIAWELLAQFALTFCIESSLPRCCGPVNVNRERTTALQTQPRQRAFL